MSFFNRSYKVRPLGMFRRQFLKIGLFSCLINLLMLAVPLYMLQIYDRVLASGSLDTLIMLTVLCVGLLFAMALFSMTRSWLLNRVADALDTTCNVTLFRAIFGKRPNLGHDSPSQPLRDLSVLRNFMMGAGLVAFFDAPWSPFYFAILFFIHPVFGLIALIGALVICILAGLNALVTRGPMAKAGQAARTSHEFIESFSRQSNVIEVMGMLKKVEQLWKINHDTAIANQSRAGDRSVVFTSLAKFVRMGLQVAVLGIGAWLAIKQIVTPGAMIAASIIMGRGLAPIEAAIGNWKGSIQARSAYKRLKRELTDTVDWQDEGRTKLPPPIGRLQVKDVSQQFDGQEDPVLQGISFALEPGEALGIMGPSGAGKSTLANLLVGLERPSAGRVTLDSVDIADWPKDEVGPYLGYVPQEMGLLSGTVAQNISRFDMLYAADDQDAQSSMIVDAAKFAGTHELIVRLPQGYETKIGENGRLISGGQRQRIALARAVYGDTRFVVLDEPNSNLDAEGSAALRDTISGLKKQGCTVVVITHTSSILGVLDKLLLLQDGRACAFGPREQIIASRLAPVAQARTKSAKNTKSSAADERENHAK